MAPTNTAQDLFSVKGMVVVITGGGSGLGLYAARALDANGAKAVYIIGRREASLIGAAKTGINGAIKPIVGDVTSKDSLAKIAEQVQQEQGYINLLFANAGSLGPSQGGNLEVADKANLPSVQDIQQRFWSTSAEDYTHTQHVNNTAVFFTAVAFMSLLDAGNKQRNVPQDSQILVTSSIAGFGREMGVGFPYSTSKAAATHLVKMLATFFAHNQFRIRVNLIAPGVYPSEMTEHVTGKQEKVQAVGGAFEGATVMPLERCPGGRTGSEDDFAGTVLFLASRAGAYLNGMAMVTDGGRLTTQPAVY